MSTAAKEVAMSVFDNDGDNRISRDDFEVLIEQSNISGANPANIQALNQSIQRMCHAIELSNGVSYSYEEYRLKIQSKLEEPLVQEAMLNILDVYFDRLDTDQDGFISPKEYRSYMQDLGHTDPNEIDDAYNSIDTSGEGKIRRVEWVNYGFEYFYSESRFKANDRKNEGIQAGAPCCGRQSIYCVPCPNCFL